MRICLVMKVSLVISFALSPSAAACGKGVISVRLLRQGDKKIDLGSRNLCPSQVAAPEAASSTQRAEARPLGRATFTEWLGDWDGHSGGVRSPAMVRCLSPLVPAGVQQGQAENGGIVVLAAAYWVAGA